MFVFFVTFHREDNYLLITDLFIYLFFLLKSAKQEIGGEEYSLVDLEKDNDFVTF